MAGCGRARQADRQIIGTYEANFNYGTLSYYRIRSSGCHVPLSRHSFRNSSTTRYKGLSTTRTDPVVRVVLALSTTAGGQLRGQESEREKTALSRKRMLPFDKSSTDPHNGLPIRLSTAFLRACQWLACVPVNGKSVELTEPVESAESAESAE